MQILQYSLRRLLYLIPVILGVSFVVFFLFNVVAGDPTPLLLGKNATPSQIAELRSQLGLDRPFFMQYLDIVKSAFTFDFGRSWSTQQKISEIISQRAIPSLTLTLPAFILASILGILISLVVSFYRGKTLDVSMRVLCIALMSISSLVYIIVGQKILAADLGLFEISGYETGFPDFVPYIILPVIIWIVLSLGPDIRFFRTVILDEVYQDYVRTARAKGLSEKVIFLKHVLRNAMVPMITYFVIQLPFLIMGSLLLENYFDIPGLGSEVVRAANSNDFPVLKAFAILFSVAYIVFNLITDILYAVVDPRIKLQ